jgi:hypothetical protein
LQLFALDDEAAISEGESIMERNERFYVFYLDWIGIEIVADDSTCAVSAWPAKPPCFFLGTHKLTDTVSSEQLLVHFFQVLRR